jgi:predicted TIM-barrel fold metal-dependent hydrolase
VGSRIRLQPRSIAIFYAWSPAEAKAFLDQANPPLTAPQRAAIEANIAFVREHGFSVHVQNPAAPASDWGIEITPGDDPGLRVVLLNRLVADQSYAISSIVAPVFDARGRVEFVLGLMGFNRAMTGDEIAAAAERLKAACARIGNFMADRSE